MTEPTARRVFAFKSDEGWLRAVSLLKDGGNLPSLAKGHWRSLGEITVGVQEVLPFDIPPEPLLRGLEAQGYFVWDAAHGLPHGTSQ